MYKKSSKYFVCLVSVVLKTSIELTPPISQVEDIETEKQLKWKIKMNGSPVFYLKLALPK